jgi:hypothetical protein
MATDISASSSVAPSSVKNRGWTVAFGGLVVAGFGLALVYLAPKQSR